MPRVTRRREFNEIYIHFDKSVISSIRLIIRTDGKDRNIFRCIRWMKHSAEQGNIIAIANLNLLKNNPNITGEMLQLTNSFTDRVNNKVKI